MKAPMSAEAEAILSNPAEAEKLYTAIRTAIKLAQGSDSVQQRTFSEKISSAGVHVTVRSPVTS